MTPLVALTPGDPNGIGPEVLLKAARDSAVRAVARVVAVGSAEGLAAQADALGLGPVAVVRAPDDPAPDGALAVWDVPGAHATVTPGRVTADGGRAAMTAVEAAARLALAGDVDAITTAPISKEAIHAAGWRVPGHTEFLEQIAGETAVMVLAADLPVAGGRPAGALRVALATVHEPLARVASLVTPGRLDAVIRTLDAALRRDLGIARPRLAVLGLNPHAGDGGVLGTEERDVIAPALAALAADGLDVAGPHPADAFFGRAAWRGADAVVAMYHDQGLAPFKALAQGAGVNVTLGLPIVRTSPDHGTAFDLAGQGRADAASMVAAIRMAAGIGERRAGSRKREGHE